MTTEIKRFDLALTQFSRPSGPRSAALARAPVPEPARQALTDLAAAAVDRQW